MFPSNAQIIGGINNTVKAIRDRHQALGIARCAPVDIVGTDLQLNPEAALVHADNGQPANLNGLRRELLVTTAFQLERQLKNISQ